MKKSVIDIQGNQIKEIELNDSVFNIKYNKNAIYEIIKNELANRRQGTSSTKTKSEVNGSGIKPWRQKGTGRARVGTRRNPLWKGGGVAFGPKPRDYSYQLPKKIKRLAYKSILSLKNLEGNLNIIENLSLAHGKTKEVFTIFSNILKNDDYNARKLALVISENDKSKMIKRACRNIPWITCLNYNRLEAHALFYSNNIFLTEDAATELNKFYN